MKMKSRSGREEVRWERGRGKVMIDMKFYAHQGLFPS